MELSSGVVYSLAAIGHRIGEHQPNMRKGIKKGHYLEAHGNSETHFVLLWAGERMINSQIRGPSSRGP